MKKTNLINALLSLAALFSFLCLDFYGFGGNKNFNGFEMLDKNNDFFLWLQAIVPIIVFLVNIATSANNNLIGRIFTFTMLIPVVAMISKVDTDCLKVGFYIYLFISISMMILSIVHGSINTTSKENKDTDSSTNDNQRNQYKKDIRNNYNDEQLQNVVDNADQYDKLLVEECRTELEIRNAAKAFAEEVKALGTDNINEILSNKSLYSEAFVYAVELEQKERERIRLEKEAQERELERQRIEKEAEEAYLHRIAWWRKWRWYVIGAIAIFVAIILAIYFTSDSYYYNSGAYKFDSGKPQVAIKKLTKIDNPDNSRYYLAAKYQLYRIYNQLEDADNASKMVQDIYEAVRFCDAGKLNSNWSSSISKSAYELCAKSILLERYIQADTIDYETALKLFNNTRNAMYSGACLYHLGRQNEALDLLEDRKDGFSRIYTGIIKNRLYKTYEEFDNVNWEYNISVSDIEKDKKWCCDADGGLWNVDIVKRFLTTKGDLELILGKQSDSNEEKFKTAYDFYSKAAELFPDDIRCVKRYQILKKVADVPIKRKSYNNWVHWSQTSIEDRHYLGEYTGEFGHSWWENKIKPHGYGMYTEYKGALSQIKRIVVGRLTNVGKDQWDNHKLRWGQNNLVIALTEDESKYDLGYWEKGKYYYLTSYTK